MQTVIEPTVVPQIIEIPSTRKERRLQRMIDMVREGKWCRDYMHSWTNPGSHCVLGMIEVTKEDG